MRKKKILLAWKVTLYLMRFQKITWKRLYLNTFIHLALQVLLIIFTFCNHSYVFIILLYVWLRHKQADEETCWGDLTIEKWRIKIARIEQSFNKGNWSRYWVSSHFFSDKSLCCTTYGGTSLHMRLLMNHYTSPHWFVYVWNHSGLKKIPFVSFK